MCITANLDIPQPQSSTSIEFNSYNKSNLFMKVRCDNCGSFAERYSTGPNTTTECPKCDYLIERDVEGNVIRTSFSW